MDIAKLCGTPPLKRPRAGRIVAAAFLLLLAAVSPLPRTTPAAAIPEGEKIHWKPVLFATAKIAGQPLKIWNLYEGDKKRKLFLMQAWRRILIIDLRDHTVHAPPPADFPAAFKGAEFEGRGVLPSDDLIPTSDWTESDVGPAELIRVTLGDFGQTLELQVPHPVNFRLGIY